MTRRKAMSIDRFLAAYVGPTRISTISLYTYASLTYYCSLLATFLLTSTPPIYSHDVYPKYNVVINTVSDPVTRRDLASRLLGQVDHETNDDDGIEV